MLARLMIEDVVLVERLELELKAGMTVLTGETGAGKSIILDSLALATGGRADVGLIRAGCDRAQVLAEFWSKDAALLAQLAEKGVEWGQDEPLLLKRQINRDGRSRAFVNDQPVGVLILKLIGATCLEVHGQHDTVGLLDARLHGDFLDRFGSLGNVLEKLKTTYQNYRAAQQEVEAQARQRQADLSLRADLEARLSELERLNPVADEEDRLACERAILGAGERALEDINEAVSAVGGDQLTQRLMKAFRALDHARTRAKSAGAQETDAVFLSLSAAAEALDRTLIAADEALSLMDQAAMSLNVEPGQLDRVEERLFALRAQARKMNLQVADLPRARADLAKRLMAIDDSEASFKALNEKLSQTKAEFEQNCHALSQARGLAAKHLEAAVKAELGPLKLDKAQFRVTLEPLEAGQWNALGAEKISFEVKTNPGAAWGGLAVIASGGELARFALALKAALSTRQTDGQGPVMIFDEVDQGVGGAVADAVGMRLKSLAKGSQVIVVTHSPQVAACGDQHLKVVKGETQGGVRSQVFELNQDQSLEELARMLSGAEITPEARGAAKRLKNLSEVSL